LDVSVNSGDGGVLRALGPAASRLTLAAIPTSSPGTGTQGSDGNRDGPIVEVRGEGRCEEHHSMKGGGKLVPVAEVPQMQKKKGSDPVNPLREQCR
jgi:hypothetical protein